METSREIRTDKSPLKRGVSDLSEGVCISNKIRFEKRLRQKIMAISIAKLNWDKEFLHKMMEDWGFGNSLRALNAVQLIKLKRMLFPKPEFSYDTKFQYDDQGKYMYYVMKLAGWIPSRVRAYMIKHFSKSHWNLLNEKEKRGVINMLKRYGRNKIRSKYE